MTKAKREEKKKQSMRKTVRLTVEESTTERLRNAGLNKETLVDIHKQKKMESGKMKEKKGVNQIGSAL